MLLIKNIIILINLTSSVNFIFFYVLLMGSVWIYDSDTKNLIVEPGTWFLTSVILSSISFPIHILCIYLVIKNFKLKNILKSFFFSLIPFCYLLCYSIVFSILGNNPFFYLIRTKTFILFFEDIKSFL